MVLNLSLYKTKGFEQRFVYVSPAYAGRYNDFVLK